MKKLVVYFVVCLTALLYSCRVQQLPTVEHVSHELQLSLQYDSISRDHFRYMWLRGDTVYVTDSVFIDRWRVRTDSITRTDSIPYKVEIPVPGFMTRSQHFFYNSGVAAWCLVAALVLAAVICVILKILR